MQDAPKAVLSIPYICGIFPSLKQNFMAYRSSKVSWHPDCIFEIHPMWQSVFSRAYSNCCCSCSFKPEIIKIGQLSYKRYSKNLLNFQESTTILNACTKKTGNLFNGPRIYIHIHTFIYIYTYTHTYIYTHIYLYTHTHTHIYIYAYTHIYIHTYTHTHMVYSNNILNFQESTTILNACTKISGNLLNSPRVYIYMYIYTLYFSVYDAHGLRRYLVDNISLYPF